jgi:RNA-directed DNA polymerase
VSLKALQQATSLRTFAPLIGYKPASLAFIIRQIPPDKRYHSFEIPKKNGGVRKIDAPIDKLKVLQRHLADFLTKCVDEIENSGAQKSTVSHGYRAGFSIVTNARQHRNRRYVLNLDIENFFPSLNFGRVRGFFIKNEHFKLHSNVATVIAQIACHNNALPQGSPCSPLISDLLARVLDIRLTQLARRHKCTYSRYVDDLTFSTGKRDFPGAIAYQVEGHHVWAAGGEILRDISRLGFSINHVKTRMQYRTSRQVVTGLTVNKKININSDYYRSARAMCHSLFTIGSFKKHDPSFKKAEQDPKKPVVGAVAPIEKAPTVNQLVGILSHIQYVKDQERERTQTEDQKLDQNKKVVPRGLHKLHKRLLFFKYFVAPDKPIIVCEGKTDSIYLRGAIRRLPSVHPKLVNTEGGKATNKISFFSYRNTAHKILQLSGGSDPLKEFIINYDQCIDYYKFTPLAHPVIILVDNDGGADGIFKYLSGKHVAVSLTSTAAFYHISKNLYLVKTPETGAKGDSCIEELFDKSLWKEKVEGKSFNIKKEHASPTEYGKTVFAEKVILPNAKTIDFANFEPLLQRIISVVESYTPSKAAP